MEIENLVSQRSGSDRRGQNLRKIHSVSRRPVRRGPQFAWGTNMDQAGLDVRDKLDILQLPLDAKAGIAAFQSVDRSDHASVLGVAADGKGVVSGPSSSLRRFADDEEASRTDTRCRGSQGRRRHESTSRSISSACNGSTSTLPT